MKIYIILSYTGSNLSRAIKLFTKEDYSHVSIALDDKLEYMFSFGRKNPSNPFQAGFVQEFHDKGTFAKFKNTICKIGYIEVTVEQYVNLCNKICVFIENEERYRYNILGICALAINREYTKKDYYFCSHFVAEILKQADIVVFNKPSSIVKPADFYNLIDETTIYEDYICNYAPSSFC